MDFRPLSVLERRQLRDALLDNGRTEGRTGLLMDRTTRFTGVDESLLDEDAQTIHAIRSVPVHY